MKMFGRVVRILLRILSEPKLFLRFNELMTEGVSSVVTEENCEWSVESCNLGRDVTVGLVEFWRRGIQWALCFEWVGDPESAIWYKGRDLQLLGPKLFDDLLGILRCASVSAMKLLKQDFAPLKDANFDAALEVVQLVLKRLIAPGCKQFWIPFFALNWDALSVVDLIYSVRRYNAVSTFFGSLEFWRCLEPWLFQEEG